MFLCGQPCVVLVWCCCSGQSVSWRRPSRQPTQIAGGCLKAKHGHPPTRVGRLAGTDNCIALGSSIVATGGQERRCCVWRLKDADTQSLRPTSSITCLDLDHDQTHVLSGCEGGSARVYDLREARRRVDGPPEPSKLLSISPVRRWWPPEGRFDGEGLGRPEKARRPTRATAARSTLLFFLMALAGVGVRVTESGSGT